MLLVDLDDGLNSRTNMKLLLKTSACVIEQSRCLETSTSDRNPEPPADLEDEQLLDADNIGSTVFSKRWTLSTLMKLVKVSWQSYVDEGAMS